MIKLGKLANSKATTVISIYKFDMENLSWSKVPATVEFNEEKQPFGSGGFRNAYKATTKHPEFNCPTWVIKRYLPEALKSIDEVGQTIEEHTRKVVQMHLLARNFALQLEEKIKQNGISSFGEVFKYKMIYFGKTDQEEYVTIEEFIDGRFTKYLNNTGLLCVDGSDTLGQKAECLAHFSYEKSEKKLMLVDVQGNGYKLFDPEIASVELFDKSQKFMYCTGNLSELAIQNFVSKHKCNEFCILIGLKGLQ